MLPIRLPLYLLLVQGFHPSGPFVLAKGTGLLVSQGRMDFLFNLFPLLAILQEMVSATIVALHLFPSSPLGLRPAQAGATLALHLLLFFNHLEISSR